MKQKLGIILCLFLCSYEMQAQQQIFSYNQTITEGRVWDVAFEDLNKDGFSDMLIADWFKPPTIFYNDLNGKFDNYKSLISHEANDSFYRVHGIGINDFNNDNNPDIFAVFNGLNTLLYISDSEASFKVDTINTNNSDGLYLSLGDADNDNDIDVLVTNYKQPAVLWKNDGNGNFKKLDFNFGTGSFNPALGDINDDGLLDVICSVNGNVIIWFNEGNDNYKQSSQSIGYSNGFGKVWLADMDNDKDLDIVFANNSEGGSIWSNNGSGVFSETNSKLTKSSTMCVGDIDLNGRMDIIFGNTIWLNNGNNLFTEHVTFEIEGRIFGLWLNDFDNDGDLDLFYSSSIPEKGLVLLMNTTKTN